MRARPAERLGMSPRGRRSAKVLMLHRGGASQRGMEVCAIGAGQAFVEAGHDLYVARNSRSMDRDLRPVAAELVHFEFPEIMLDGSQCSLPLLRFTRAFRRLSRLVDEWGIDVIYASGGLPCQVGVPVAKRRGIRLLCHFHHPAPRRYYYFWLVRMADRVVFPSEFTRDHSRAKGGVQGVVVHNGVDVQRFRPAPDRDPDVRSRLGIPADAVVMGQVGTLVPHKRGDYLVELFGRLAPGHPRLHLVLVGDGPMASSLREQVDQLGLAGRITLTGYVDDVLPYYQDVIDINVSVSREEGLGLSILEGAACGLPAIACEAGGLRETIIDGQTGYLVGVNDAEAFLDRTVTLALDEGLRASLGRAARRRIERDFTAASYGRKMVEQLDALMEETP